MAETLSLGKVDRLLLFGGARLMHKFAPRAKKLGWPVVVFSSGRHLDEAVELEGLTLRDSLQAAGIPFYSSDEINADPAALEHVTPTTLAIAMGAAWVFDKEFAARFNGRLLDFMGIRLPLYRGGAHYTWQILAGDRRGGLNLQVIEGGLETFHRGPLVAQATYPVPARCRIPLDYFEAALPREIAFLEKFLAQAKKNKPFRLIRLKEESSTYWPFLHTPTHGWIDWSWDARALERFVCAFDDPYAGASTMYQGRKLRLKQAWFSRESTDHHPFHAGVVYRKVGSTVFVAARGGGLRVDRLLDDAGQDASADLPLGARLHTPADRLAAALGFSAVYGAKGLE
ncbi:MAG: hypothetical protein HY553_09190 [Elusimicrobia bacterium]|nr:hypothetical protein [Elusimicrobiota bacterium]